MSGDPARQLLRAIGRSAAAAGCDIAMEHRATRPWSSATFVGAQHEIGVAGHGLSAWLAALPEEELPLCGAFVASCNVKRTEEGAVLTMLVLDA